MRIAFMATPGFALPALKMLYERGFNAHNMAVFTQPDRPQGRGKKLLPPTVKPLAQELGLSVFQFESLRCSAGVGALKNFAPDLMITVAFGQILTQEILDIPRLGCINVHASLLPKYRGAAPIQQCIIDGELITGVTTMLTDIGLDTGDILLAQTTTIVPNETAGELSARLSIIGAQVLNDTITTLENGTLTRTPQDVSHATKCRTIRKEHAKINFSHTADTIHNLVRGMNPVPYAHCMWHDAVIKITKTLPRPDVNPNESYPYGTCFIANPKQGLMVVTGSGTLEILELQFPNSRKMSAKEALNSKRLQGEVLQ